MNVVYFRGLSHSILYFSYVYTYTFSYVLYIYIILVLWNLKKLSREDDSLLLFNLGVVQHNAEVHDIKKLESPSYPKC